jgi:hypothetical protein
MAYQTSWWQENRKKIKVGVVCFLAGMAFCAFVGFKYFDWYSRSQAERLARETSADDVVAALAPGCAREFKALPDAAVRRAGLAESEKTYSSSSSSSKFIPDELVTLPGKTLTDYRLTNLCTKLVLAEKAVSN